MRTARCVLLTIVVFAALLVPATPASAGVTLKVNEHKLLNLINSVRSQHGLAKLRVNAALTNAARSHSREMLRRNYFSHFSAGGTSFSTRILRAGYKCAGYRYWSVGENLGWGRGAFGTPQAIFRAWMRSSIHRANILRSQWRDIGLGEVVGTYRGKSGVLMYTIDFGRRY